MKAILSPADFETLFRMVWTGDVKQRYEQGGLNSERALQACLVGALTNAEPNLIVHVEPTLYPEAREAREMVPDLWIGQCGSGKALAVIELKFVPFHLPQWERDLQKLLQLLMGSLYACRIDPRTGRDRDDDEGQIVACSETLGVFAVVGQADSVAVDTPSIRGGLNGSNDLLARVLHAWGKISSREPSIDFGVDRLSIARR